MLLDKLRDEVIEAQRAQASVAHWKLLLIATFGAAGLGLFPSSRESDPHILVLGLLPFICSYADVLSYNSGIRVLSIARYFRLRLGRRDTTGPEGVPFDDATDYELHAAKHRALFDLEVVALRWTSEVVSIVVAASGLLVAAWPDLYSLHQSRVSVRVAVVIWLVACGVTGGLLADDLYYRHRRNVKRFDGRLARKPRRSLFAFAAVYLQIVSRTMSRMSKRTA